MDLEALRDLVGWIVNFDNTAPQQDFIGPSTDTYKHIDRALNLSYQQEVNLATQNAARGYFQRVHAFTWSADTQTMTIPSVILRKPIIAIYDATDSTPGSIIPLWDALTAGSGLYNKDVATWGWTPVPSSARTLNVLYIASAEAMKDIADEPDLIPTEYRELLAWSASILLREVADGNAPPPWYMKQDSLRKQFWKMVASGSPMLHPPPRIRNSSGENEFF
jgi:hypothetical protein